VVTQTGSHDAVGIFSFGIVVLFCVTALFRRRFRSIIIDPLEVFLVTLPTMHEVGGLENPQRNALAAFARQIKNGGAEEALSAQFP
jgi:hypothetical protein